MLSTNKRSTNKFSKLNKNGKAKLFILVIVIILVVVPCVALMTSPFIAGNDSSESNEAVLSDQLVGAEDFSAGAIPIVSQDVVTTIPITVTNSGPSNAEEETNNIVQFVQYRNYKVYPKMAKTIALATEKASKEFFIPRDILVAIMDIESDYRYDAVSKSVSVGVMQIHVATWLNKDNRSNLITAGIAKSKKDLFDPEINIRAGAYILHLYMMEGKKKGVTNPVEYAATRYFGGVKNTYYSKLVAALGEFKIFKYTTLMERTVK